jgi:hypothetical protein
VVAGYGLSQTVSAPPGAAAAKVPQPAGRLTKKRAAELLLAAADAAQAPGDDAAQAAVSVPWEALIPVLLDLLGKWMARRGK